MDAPSTPGQADAATLLPRATYYQVAHTLRTLLPPPITEAPEDEARRDIAAIAHVASLRPANAEEANLAVQYVAASAQALYCLRQARRCQDDLRLFLRCTAQSASMMRQARQWLTVLHRAQAAREKREKDAATREAATQTEQRALGLMAEGLATPPPKTEPQADVIAEAERYAQEHRKRATLIRRFGGVPRKLNFGPLSPALVHAIATGTTPSLRALDQKPTRVAAQVT